MDGYPLKVVHVIQRDDSSTGGALRVAFELARRLPGYDIDARLLFLYGDNGYFGSQLPDRSDYLRIDNSKRIWQLVRFRAYLQATRPDIVHFHDDLLWPQILTPGHRPWKTIIHAHGGGTAPPQPLKTWLMYAYQRRHADAVVCITQEARDSQLHNVGFHPDLLHVVYNGVDTGHFRPPSPEERALAKSEFGLSADKVVLGFVGRLHDAMKGCQDFVKLVASLPEDFVGIVAGTGPDAPALREQAEQLGVSHRICFAGLLDDPLLAYHAMSVFCFMSRHEPFGLTVAEAMACTLPVVGFQCPGGTGEILTNETGSVIAKRDLTEMAREVQSAAQGDEPWPARIAAARQLIESRHQWGDAAGKLAEFYHRLLSDTYEKR